MGRGAYRDVESGDLTTLINVYSDDKSAGSGACRCVGLVGWTVGWWTAWKWQWQYARLEYGCGVTDDGIEGRQRRIVEADCW